MKQYTFLLPLILASGIYQSQAQDLSIASGTDLFIASGTTYHSNGLTLVPSSNFTLSGTNSITKNTTLSSPPGPTYVSRVYLFGSTTGNYSGTIQINYSDGELNGLTESTLQVNNYTGSTWANHSSATNNTTDNYVLSIALSNVQLNEISLAASSAPLPVTWLTFDAVKQNKSALISWSTAQEINSHTFEVLRSADGLAYTSLHTVAGAGNKSNISCYSFVDTNPGTGLNYYRILQRDYDGTASYSDIKAIDFNLNLTDFVVLSNPATDGTLNLNLNLNFNLNLNLYDLSGRLLIEQKAQAGFNRIDISHLNKGMYVLNVNNKSMRIMVL